MRRMAAILWLTGICAITTGTRFKVLTVDDALGLTALISVLYALIHHTSE